MEADTDELGTNTAEVIYYYENGSLVREKKKFFRTGQINLQVFEIQKKSLWIGREMKMLYISREQVLGKERLEEK